MNNKEEIKKLLYDREIGPKLRKVMSQMFTPDLNKNDGAFDDLAMIIFNPDNDFNYNSKRWICVMEFLWENVPDFLSYFNHMRTATFLAMNRGVTCSWLPKRLVIPKNIKTIHSGAFYKCATEEIVFEQGSKLYDIMPCAFSCASDTINNRSVVKELDLSDTKLIGINDIGVEIYRLYLPNTINYIAPDALTHVGELYFPNASSVTDLTVEIDRRACIFNDHHYYNTIPIHTQTEDLELEPVETPSIVLENGTKIITFGKNWPTDHKWEIK